MIKIWYPEWLLAYDKYKFIDFYYIFFNIYAVDEDNKGVHCNNRVELLIQRQNSCRGRAKWWQRIG